MSDEIIELDGSHGEGGGQILRNAVALAAIKGLPLEISNIRRNRKSPGLRPQHLNSVELVRKLCSAKVKGLRENSLDLQFYPKNLQGGRFKCNIGTAGSITLLLQCILPVLAFTPERTSLQIIGGTSVKWSPPFPFMTNIFLPILLKMGFDSDIQLVQRGYYPKGGGQVNVDVMPIEKIDPIIMTKYDTVQKIEGISYCSNLPLHVAERQANSSKKYLASQGFNDVSIEVMTDNHAKSPGSGIVLWTKSPGDVIIGGSSLGERRKKAEKVGNEAAQQLLAQLMVKKPVDRYITDQLIIWMALASGISRIESVELTLHTKTAIELCETILGAEFEVIGNLGTPVTIECHGVGLSNK